MDSTQPQPTSTNADSKSFNLFAKRVIESGLMTRVKLEAFLQELPQRPESGELLAKAMVRRRKLTKFQAQTIYSGKGKQLLLGNYLITEKIGAGGMGQVYKAVHKRMDRVVAIKVLPTSVTRSSQAVERFQREARAVAKLNHPNIVTAHDADEFRNIHFLVMEFVEGADLQAVVKQAGPMPVSRAVHYVIQAAVGLQFAHSKGIVEFPKKS